MKNLNLPKEATFKGPALLWKRVLAFFLDIMIIDFVVGFPLRGILERVLPKAGFRESYDYLLVNPETSALISYVILLWGVLALLYFTILEYRLGQTVGKMLLNIKVEPSDKKMSFLHTIMRNLFIIPIFPFILLWIIDPLFMVFSKEKRRLSEVLSKTRTVETYLLR